MKLSRLWAVYPATRLSCLADVLDTVQVSELGNHFRSGSPPDSLHTDRRSAGDAAFDALGRAGASAEALAQARRRLDSPSIDDFAGLELARAELAGLLQLDGEGRGPRERLEAMGIPRSVSGQTLEQLERSRFDLDFALGTLKAAEPHRR